jgi:cell division protein FtsB
MSGEEPATTPRRTSLTGRAAILALVVCMLAISLAYPLREYLSQRGEIGDYRAQVLAQQQRVTALQKANARWKDPAYVKEQARERLHFVMPGETSYIVLGPHDSSDPNARQDPQLQTDDRRPWFTDLWHSVEVAGR